MYTQNLTVADNGYAIKIPRKEIKKNPSYILQGYVLSTQNDKGFHLTVMKLKNLVKVKDHLSWLKRSHFQQGHRDPFSDSSIKGKI